MLPLLKEPRLVLVEFPPRHAVELAADVFVAFKTVRPAADFGDIAHAEAGDEGIERIPWKIQVRHPVQQFLLPALILAVDFGISGGIDDGDAAHAAGFGVGLFLVLEERKMLFDELHDHFPRRGVEFGQLDAGGTGVTHLAFRLGFGGIEETEHDGAALAKVRLDARDHVGQRVGHHQLQEEPLLGGIEMGVTVAVAALAGVAFGSLEFDQEFRPEVGNPVVLCPFILAEPMEQGFVFDGTVRDNAPVRQAGRAVADRAGKVGAHALEVAAEHFHRPDAAPFHGHEKRRKIRERCSGPPEPKAFVGGHVPGLRRPGCTEVANAGLRKEPLQGNSHVAAERAVIDRRLAAVRRGGGVLHQMGLVEGDHAVEVRHPANRSTA